jgi:hypothetical protein
MPVYLTLQSLLKIQYMGTTYTYQKMPFGLFDVFPNIHTNKEKMCNSNKRNMEDQMCSLLGQLVTSLSQQKSFKQNSPTVTKFLMDNQLRSLTWTFLQQFQYIDSSIRDKRRY